MVDVVCGILREDFIVVELPPPLFVDVSPIYENPLLFISIYVVKDFWFSVAVEFSAANGSPQSEGVGNRIEGLFFPKKQTPKLLQKCKLGVSQSECEVDGDVSAG